MTGKSHKRQSRGFVRAKGQTIEGTNGDAENISDDFLERKNDGSADDMGSPARRPVKPQTGKERTMTSQVDRANHTLFSSNGQQVVNVKFFLGSGRDVTAEELAEQFNRTEAQVRTGDAVPSVHLDAEVKTQPIR